MILQPAVSENIPDPDPVAWRDLALDMYTNEVNLVDYMWRVSDMADHESEPKRKQMLAEATDSLQRWQAHLGIAISQMRESRWNDVKIEIEKADDVAREPSLDSLMKSVWQFKGAIEVQRKENLDFRSRVKTYPSRLTIPKDRISTILKLQVQLLKLHEIRNEIEKNLAIHDAVSYPIEKLGTALLYLMSQSASRAVILDREQKKPGLHSEQDYRRLLTI